MDIKNVQSNYTYERFFKEHWLEEINHRFKLQIILCFLTIMLLVVAWFMQRKLQLYGETMTMKEGTVRFTKELCLTHYSKIL